MKRNEKIIFGLMLVSLVIVLSITWTIQTHRPYTETVVLEKQYIGNITNGCAGGCENCLIMEVSKKEYNKTYYFASEHEIRHDLVEGYEIKVQWRYVFTKGYYRIRNIYQPTPKDGFQLN